MRDVSCENCGLEVCGMRRPSSTFAAVASSHSGIAELPTTSIQGYNKLLDLQIVSM